MKIFFLMAIGLMLLPTVSYVSATLQRQPSTTPRPTPTPAISAEATVTWLKGKFEEYGNSDKFDYKEHTKLSDFRDCAVIFERTRIIIKGKTQGYKDIERFTVYLSSISTPISNPWEKENTSEMVLYVPTGKKIVYYKVSYRPSGEKWYENTTAEERLFLQFSNLGVDNLDVARRVKNALQNLATLCSENKVNNEPF
jgi:hypothetical protein